MYYRVLEVTDDPDNVLGTLHSAARSMLAFKKRREEEEAHRIVEAEKEARKARHGKLRRLGRLSPSEARVHASRANSNSAQKKDRKVSLPPQKLAREWVEKMRCGTLAERRMAAAPPSFRLGVMERGEPEAVAQRGSQSRSVRIRPDIKPEPTERLAERLAERRSGVRIGGLGSLRVRDRPEGVSHAGIRSQRPKRSTYSPVGWRLGTNEDGWLDGTIMIGYPGSAGASAVLRRQTWRPASQASSGARACDTPTWSTEPFDIPPVPKGKAEFYALKREWPALHFLFTREFYTGEETLLRAAALDYIHANPHLTRREIEALGFGGPQGLELLADSHEALRPLLQQVTKSKDNDLLSPRWFYRLRREGREVSMPDSLDGYDDSGSDRPVVGQAFEAQVFDALYASHSGGFFS